jgi:hypothetical protein
MVSGKNPGPLALLSRARIQVQTFYNIRHLVSETELDALGLTLEATFPN